MKHRLFLLACAASMLLPCLHGQNDGSRRRPRMRRMAFVTDTLMVHDPVMAWEGGTCYLLSTGQGLQWATSGDRRSWIVQPTPFIEQLPEWTRDSVPGFRSHVWAPDILRWHDRWLLAYSCSTFGKNTSAIGLMSADRLNGQWRDEGCLVASREKRDNWNAIDPCLATDGDGQLWMAWGSFWDGIQMARVESREKGGGYTHSTPKTIARRYRPDDPDAPENPTSRFAGRNAIEAPFIFRHGAWYYLFVSWDYCCRGRKSNYRVAVGRSEKIDGPYTDREGRDMAYGGGTIVIEGDKREYEATGHCAVYDLADGHTLFICHGYSTARDGESTLVQKDMRWTADGWPTTDAQ